MKWRKSQKTKALSKSTNLLLFQILKIFLESLAKKSDKQTVSFIVHNYQKIFFFLLLNLILNELRFFFFFLLAISN